jgi:hypothetical protein
MSVVSSEALETARPLAAFLEETSLSWTAAGSVWLADTETASIHAEANGDEAVFSSELVQWEDLTAAARRALAAFLDALNRRWPPVRGLLSGDKVIVQVVVSAAAWSPGEIDRALEALLFAHRRAKKECAALLHEQVAKLYLQFHEGENTDANHDD